MAADDPARPAELNPALPPDSAPTKVKSRSKVERAVVWGGILILLVVVFIEWRATDSLKADSEAVHSAMEQAEKGYLTESELERLMTRFSRRDSKKDLTANELAASRVDTFDYGGLLKKRLLYVYFGLPRPGHEQEVLQIGELPIRMYTPEEFGIRRTQDQAQDKGTDQSDQASSDQASSDQASSDQASSDQASSEEASSEEASNSKEIVRPQEEADETAVEGPQ